MVGWLASADGVLRQAPWITEQLSSRRTLWRLVGCLIAFGLLYGAAMGTFRALGGQSQWFLQIVYSAVKVPLLLTFSFAISLPSFYVLNSLFGLGSDFGRAIRALAAAQAGLAIILASLSPLTLMWYASSDNYQNALRFNGLMFLVASISAQWLVRGFYRPLIERNPRHRLLLWCWLSVYVLVAIQLAWWLRPFVGSPTADVQFIRRQAWDNAYVYVANLIWQTLFP
ncbi:MAG: hypothetical protein WD669_06555 [Pirellulales bacterium]